MNHLSKIYKYCLFIILVCCLQSCGQDNVYYSLSDEVRGFLSFEVGKTFKLKNTETDEIINLTITEKDFSFYEEPKGYSYFSFGSSSGDTYTESGKIYFTDDSGCYIGSIFASTDIENISMVSISLSGCFNQQYYQPYEYYGIIDVLNVEYKDSYLFSSYPYDLFFSKEKGILKIVDDEGVLKYSIVE